MKHRVTIRHWWAVGGFRCRCARCCYLWGPRDPRATAQWIGHYVQRRYFEQYEPFKARMRAEGHRWRTEVS